MIDLNKYSGQDKTQLFHTSGQAQVGRGSQIGSGGGQSFQQRLELANRERTVGGYNRSMMGAQRGTLRAKQFVPKPAASRSNAKDPIRSRQAFNAGDTSTATGSAPSKPSGFVEPPSRGYNPYA